MSDEWTSSTHIGQSRSRGGGATRPTTIKTKAQLNAAMRVGGVHTEKRVGSANSKPNLEGQRDRKVADESGITPLEAPSTQVSKAVKTAREKLKWSQSDLAKKCSTNASVINKLEKGEKQDKTTTIPWARLQNHLGVMLTGSNIGSPTPAAKRKAEAEAAEKKGKAKE